MDFTGFIKEAPYIAALVAIVLIFTRSIKDMQAATARSQEARDLQWREFLIEQRAQTTAALGRLSDEITDAVGEIRDVHVEQLRHDAWTREAIPAPKPRKNDTTPVTRA